MIPRFSIIIPTHNRAGLLPEAVRSVLGQTQADLELIVVDDGSTDETPAAMAAFADDGRVRYERLAQQGGRSAARNHGAQLAQAELLGFLDSDDRYLPGALDAHLQVFAAQPGMGMTVGGYQMVEAGGAVVGQRHPWEESGGLQLQDWLFNCLATPGSILLQSAWYERVSGFDSSVEIAEDWDLFLRLSHAGCPMAWVRQPVFQYRHHAGNSIHAIAGHRDASLRALDKLFSKDLQPGHIKALEPAARAWVNVNFARRHWAAGQEAHGAAALQQALALHPRLAGAEKLHLLEYLLGVNSQGETLAGENLAARLPPSLPVTSAELRSAESRVAMAQFFRLRRRASPEARRYLWAGLRSDPRWLANRGVLSFLVKQALGR